MISFYYFKKVLRNIEWQKLIFIYFYSICFGKSTQFIHIFVDLKYTFSCRCWNIYSREPFRNQSERMRENARITKHIGNQLRTSISSLTASTHHKWCDELYARLKLYIQIYKYTKRNKKNFYKPLFGWFQDTSPKKNINRMHLKFWIDKAISHPNRMRFCGFSHYEKTIYNIHLLTLIYFFCWWAFYYYYYWMFEWEQFKFHFLKEKKRKESILFTNT